MLFSSGNLSPEVTREDLTKHFGLDTSPYLRSSCWVELPAQKPGKTERFGFINIPEHLAGKLLERNGTVMYEKKIKVEPARNQVDE